MSDATKKAPKWSPEAVAELERVYVPKDMDTVAELMDTLGKSKREIIGKLGHLGFYVPADKPAPKAKDEGPTKKEILAALDATGFDTKGGDGATKPFLTAVLEAVGGEIPVASEG